MWINEAKSCIFVRQFVKVPGNRGGFKDAWIFYYDGYQNVHDKCTLLDDKLSPVLWMTSADTHMHDPFNYIETQLTSKFSTKHTFYMYPIREEKPRIPCSFLPVGTFGDPVNISEKDRAAAAQVCMHSVHACICMCGARMRAVCVCVLCS